MSDWEQFFRRMKKKYQGTCILSYEAADYLECDSTENVVDTTLADEALAAENSEEEAYETYDGAIETHFPVSDNETE